MCPLAREDLLSLEQYAEQRPVWRTRLIAHKRRRRVDLGDHLSLLFEDRLTVQYQVQEVLRACRVFEPAAIEQELANYDPLLPRPGEFRATLMLAFDSAEQAHQLMPRFAGVAAAVSLCIGEQVPIVARVDEDLPAATDAMVHLLRFPLDAQQRQALLAGDALCLAVEHPACSLVQTLHNDLQVMLRQEITADGAQ